MSSMLEQAIIDAKALKESAMKKPTTRTRKTTTKTATKS